jgi:hypothetical protein
MTDWVTFVVVAIPLAGFVITTIAVWQAQGKRDALEEARRARQRPISDKRIARMHVIDSDPGRCQPLPPPPQTRPEENAS